MNRQLALAIELNDEATMSDFCWDGNALLAQQIHAMLNKQDGHYPILKNSNERFLTIWGSSGVGKSHLLQACCQAIYPERTSIYLPLTLLKEWGTDSIENLEDYELITIDDIDAISGQPKWEEALFHLYNRIHAKDNALLIISSKHPPNATKISLPDLRSRLNWGLVLQVHELNDEHKIQILQDRAKKRGIQLSKTVGDFLIKRCTRNMHNLLSLLDRLDEASLAAQRKITIPFVKMVISN